MAASLNSSDNAIRLTPVHPHSNPRVKSPNSNIASCQTRLHIIVQLIQEDYIKWQSAQAQGLILCNTIEMIKTKILQNIEKNSTAINEYTLYSEDLYKHSSKLHSLTTIIEGIYKNAEEALRNLQALSKLSGNCNEIFYRTWHLQHFIEFLAELVERYAKEVYTKKWIIQNLPHSQSRIDLIHNTCAWEYPQYMDSYVDLMFAFLKQETKGKKI